MEPSLLTIIYLIASVTFVLGLKMLSHPESARKGNLIAAGGMTLAVFGTIFIYHDRYTDEGLHNLPWIFLALVVGGILGVLMARRVKMTAMPEMVSLFNGMGGACAALISILEFNHFLAEHFVIRVQDPGDTSVLSEGLPVNYGMLVTIFLGLIIGSVSFAGSMIAWGKLNGRIKDFSFRGQHIVNIALLAAIVGIAVILLSNISTSFSIDEGGLTNTANRVVIRGPLSFLRINTSVYVLFYTLFFFSLAYGVLFVLPIGGADMPVVISLLNSFTGVAAACGGFLYDNKVMLTGGILVGAAGTLLTILMCRAMNRSLKNVLIGSFGGGNNTAAGAGSGKDQGHVKEISLADAAVVMAYANKVMIVPGYGLAVAQAQHACHELEKMLQERGVEVKYAIHPVAGRMPGHMNVLLAEADVSYEKLQEMEQANEEFPTTDVVLVLGANDVVNPAAKRDTASPIYGMPILEVEAAKTVIVNKRSMKPGYAGIENELFFEPKTSMLFGDAKKVLQDLIGEIKNL
ncbi:NAD(P)(+) transhydrogenase (Re/Si-specific) subunit beta [Flaviaesturariibacter aridisoli]|uniref:NAD(P) transhydrogenase subunit beta n=1 Tax=Flaviaesturariibacter aridisoli TaxID=2545761 RepID=A0A4R4E6E2_9BACT|nr:NAD(P)(+) transhydrogenase (Re/Si-specific) subunit beta [Flaviaesturariibacter aridisoli]TCZ74463.1 NAD(P)(+) transhydrogenase (Re/Si-specific) subunit beta [Flaviaesturariibacter aridisoli]